MLYQLMTGGLVPGAVFMATENKTKAEVLPAAKEFSESKTVSLNGTE